MFDISQEPIVYKLKEKERTAGKLFEIFYTVIRSLENFNSEEELVALA